jgi:CDAN1-interacting nuclease 1
MPKVWWPFLGNSAELLADLDSNVLLGILCVGDCHILDLCLEWNIPPCVMLRRMLESCPAFGCKSSKTVRSIFKDSSLLRTFIADGFLEKLGKQLNEIDLESCWEEGQFLSRLECEIQECVMVDSICGPSSDHARRQAGLEFESKLYTCLNDQGVSYWTEDELRDRQFFKTPDALLRVPIAVCGSVICWIDSKATFCDKRSHKKLLEDQYDSYVNRFGPGLVIYWHGYLQSIETIKSDFVLVLDSFPRNEQITRIPCLE